MNWFMVTVFYQVVVGKLKRTIVMVPASDAKSAELIGKQKHMEEVGVPPAFVKVEAM